MKNHTKSRCQRGTSMVVSLIVTFVVGVMSIAFMSQASTMMNTAIHANERVSTAFLCDAGTNELMGNVWKAFKQSQSFNTFNAYNGASESTPKGAISGSIASIGRYSAAVTGWESYSGDPYLRKLTVRSVGWVDRNNNGVIDPGEPHTISDGAFILSMIRTPIFDKGYFINNQGWAEAQGSNSIVVNGDMHANGDITFPTPPVYVNGSVTAVYNPKLSPVNQGTISQPPAKMTQSAYSTNYSTNGRIRQSYNPSIHGAIGSTTFNQWKDYLYISQGGLDSDYRPYGSLLRDIAGTRSWTRDLRTDDATTSYIDGESPSEIPLPDLYDITYYQQLSSNFDNDALVLQKQKFLDGTNNPNYGSQAYLEVWNSSTNSYQRLSTDGNITGSAVVSGTETRPIRIYGPVTVTQDLVIKGYVSGQGTIYTGRNVHVVGSIRYVNPPDFRGSNLSNIKIQNEKADFLCLAAREAIVFGNSTNLSSTARNLMRPPNTKARYDEEGNLIAAFDGNQLDGFIRSNGTATMRRESVVLNTTINNMAETINEVSAVIYSNRIVGGDMSSSVSFNGALIAKDRGIVGFGSNLQWFINYDPRIRDVGQTLAVDVALVRSPALYRIGWQYRGFRT
ncbi:MAG: hypothetical protein ACK4XJ_06555 [Fimbriimonadaceae bacterium]